MGCQPVTSPASGLHKGKGVCPQEKGTIGHMGLAPPLLLPKPPGVALPFQGCLLLTSPWGVSGAIKWMRRTGLHMLNWLCSGCLGSDFLAGRCGDVLCSSYRLSMLSSSSWYLKVLMLVLSPFSFPLSSAVRLKLCGCVRVTDLAECLEHCVRGSFSSYRLTQEQWSQNRLLTRL